MIITLIELDIDIESEILNGRAKIPDWRGEYPRTAWPYNGR
jgi:hypothetical protein